MLSISRLNVGFYIICKRLTSNSSGSRALFTARATAAGAGQGRGMSHKTGRDAKLKTEMEINNFFGARMDLVEEKIALE